MSSVLLCGSGRSLWSDIEQIEPWGGDLMCINDAGMYISVFANLKQGEVVPIRHWFSVHGNYLPMWKTLARSFLHPELELHSTVPYEGVKDYPWLRKKTVEYKSGTSALYAALLAVKELGYREVVIAGVPLDQQGYFFSRPGCLTGGFDKRHPAWDEAKDELGGKVRAISGRLVSILS